MTSPELKGLRLRREQSDYRQHQLADAIGVSQSHYRKFEAGAVRLDIYRAKTLADMFGCRIDDLL